MGYPIIDVTFLELNGSNASMWVSWSPSDPKKSQCIAQCIQTHQICVNKHGYDVSIKFEVSLHFWPIWPTVRWLNPKRKWIMIKIVTTVYAIIFGLKERIKLVDLAILQLVAKGFFMWNSQNKGEKSMTLISKTFFNDPMFYWLLNFKVCLCFLRIFEIFIGHSKKYFLTELRKVMLFLLSV